MMRINHAGEVAAQALYRGQAFVCKDPKIKKHLIQAGEEETDHLIWCKKRLDELGGQSSILNPLWYGGSFAIGSIFGLLGEKTSLGFVEETEKQVVIHLQKHLDKISSKDKETIEILKTMQEDEDLHAGQANESGAEELESPTKKIMETTAKIMTSSSAFIDFFLPTKSGTTVDGKMTMSLKGNNGRLIFTSIRQIWLFYTIMQ